MVEAKRIGLVLTRSPGESIFLEDADTGEHIATITLVEARNGSSGARARIGIDASKKIKILREELKIR